MSAFDHDHYRMMSRLAIAAGAATMCADHWFGPFGDEPGVVFVTGLMFVVVGIFCIPERPATTRP